MTRYATMLKVIALLPVHITYEVALSLWVKQRLALLDRDRRPSHREIPRRSALAVTIPTLTNCQLIPAHLFSKIACQFESSYFGVTTSQQACSAGGGGASAPSAAMDGTLNAATNVTILRIISSPAVFTRSPRAVSTSRRRSVIASTSEMLRTPESPPGRVEAMVVQRLPRRSQRAGCAHWALPPGNTIKPPGGVRWARDAVVAAGVA
jgi:hypothetical protein